MYLQEKRPQIGGVWVDRGGPPGPTSPRTDIATGPNSVMRVTFVKDLEGPSVPPGGRALLRAS